MNTTSVPAGSANIIAQLFFVSQLLKEFIIDSLF